MALYLRACRARLLMMLRRHAPRAPRHDGNIAAAQPPRHAERSYAGALMHSERDDAAYAPLIDITR